MMSAMHPVRAVCVSLLLGAGLLWNVGCATGASQQRPTRGRVAIGVTTTGELASSLTLPSDDRTRWPHCKRQGRRRRVHERRRALRRPRSPSRRRARPVPRRWRAGAEDIRFRKAAEHGSAIQRPVQLISSEEGSDLVLARLSSSAAWQKRTNPQETRSDPHPTPPYSLLSACIGEIDAARPAGIIAATNAQRASEPAAIVSASGSQKDTP